MVDDKTKVDCCESNIIHEDIVKKVRDNMPDEDLLYDISDLFRVFGENRRDGKVIYYSLDDEHVKHIFDQAMAHIKHR